MFRHALRSSCAAAAFAVFAFLSGTASAQQEAAGGHDTSQPIEINADSLEVQQDRQIAIFTGNVDAVQGEMRLRADTLRVHYRGGDGNQGEVEGDVGATISRIDADGNVFISSPRETAEGSQGLYDVEKGVITLIGSVVLTRGDNVIRGDRVVLDLATGRSRMESVAPGGAQERVRALFVPPKKSRSQ
jgi:lipopolysaccharide export system protein LptA